jgi:hypothetical protein
MTESLATVSENGQQDAPPPMPEAPPAMPDPVPATTAAPMAASTETPTETGGWDVDTDRLRTFSESVVRARSYLDSVQKRVERMQGAELTPQLGTSPVGEQLAKKFDDRLNSTDGLRAMLAEAMTRMDRFVTSAEQAARAYEETDQAVADDLEHEDDEPS